MRELLRRTKERLRTPRSDEERKPTPAAQNPKNLESVSGIMQSAARLGTVALVYWAAKTVGDIWNQGKAELQDYEQAERNKRKASRDLAETKQRQDQKDTESIRRQIRQDFVDRERKNLPPAPKSIRGHWEGHVFIPNEQPDKKAQGKDKTKPKAPGG